MEEPLRAEIRHFLDCIERGETPETDLAQGVRVTAILLAAERSLAAGGAPLPVG
jgi:predicted dehydrogenase